MKEAILREKPTHCYLCGHPLSGQTSKDHCPPKGLFAREIRQRHDLTQLTTILVHEDCNACYSFDEEYFIETLVPFAPGSEAGDAAFKKFIEDSRNKAERRQLTEKVFRQFETRPSGLHLPAGRVIMRIEGARVARVAWKIVRGLYFHHHSNSTILPEDIYFDFTITPPNERPPEPFINVIGLSDNEKHGQYPGIFDYLFRVFELDVGKKLHYWAFLIWDRIIMTVSFHDPWSCKCENCVSTLRIWNQRALQPRIPNSARSSRCVR